MDCFQALVVFPDTISLHFLLLFELAIHGHRDLQLAASPRAMDDLGLWPWTRSDLEAQLQSRSGQATTKSRRDDGGVARPWTKPTTSRRWATMEEARAHHKHDGGEASFPLQWQSMSRRCSRRDLQICNLAVVGSAMDGDEHEPRAGDDDGGKASFPLQWQSISRRCSRRDFQIRNHGSSDSGSSMAASDGGRLADLQLRSAVLFLNSALATPPVATAEEDGEVGLEVAGEGGERVDGGEK